jgi:dipeptidyl aminopeptidase/acylaminoacyl peptidase
MDAESDRTSTDIFMAPIDGGDKFQLTTTTDESESSPRWSPDGRYLAFLSGRDDDNTQVWLLDRRGGEAKKLTAYDTGVSSIAWSPDGQRLAMVMRDIEDDSGNDARDEDDDADGGGRDPIVVTRLQFKRDSRGYLNDLRRHIYVFDLESQQTDQITSGPQDDGAPVWSPDGESIAFTSNRTAEPDATANTDRPRRRPPRHPRPVAARSPSRHTILSQGVEGTGPVAPPLDHGQTAELLGGAPHRDAIRPTQHAAVREQPSRGLASADATTRAADAGVQVHGTGAAISLGARTRAESLSHRPSSDASRPPSPVTRTCLRGLA